MLKTKKLAASVGLAVLSMVGSAANAALIDPFGTGGASVYDVMNLGWGNGNAISAPIDTFNGTVNQTQVGDLIQTFGHAKLTNFADENNDTITINGFNPNSWSYVFGFAEEVAVATDSATDSARTFRVVDGGVNFFEIWVGGAAATDLTGKGFNGDGGAVKVLSGSVLAWNALTGDGQTNFASSSQNLVTLDQNGANNYTGYQTVTGTGGGKINVAIDYVDSAYFLDGLGLLTLELVTDTFQNLPFQQVNPSSCFWDGSAYISGAGNGIAGGCGVAGDGGTVGLINGVYAGAYGPPGSEQIWTNTMFQTRATTVLPTLKVPEPGTLALLGLSLIGLATVRRKV